MVGRRRARSRRLAASHQRSWLWGRHAVLELLSSGRWPPLELRIADRLDPQTREQVRAAADQARIACSEHPFEALTRWCGAREHQGLLALMPPFPYRELDEVLPVLREPALILVLDRIQDPYNFGAMLRSAEVFGVDAVVIGEREQCDVTPHVVRSSAGAAQHLTICRVPDLAQAVCQIRHTPALGGWQTLVAAADAERTAAECDLRGSTAIVVGNEGSGVADELREACSTAVRIPQVGRVGSLNAAVATGILLYEIQRQRGTGANPPQGECFPPLGERTAR